jgi:hypothetical protein
MIESRSFDKTAPKVGRRRQRRLCSAVLFAATLLVAQSASQPTHWYDAVDLHAMVDVDYAWNADQPATGDNFTSDTGTSAKSHNQIALNLASIDVAMAPEPIGFHLALNFGNATDVVHAGEAHPELWKYVQQATAAALAPIGHGLLFEAGIMPSFIGLESLQSKDNWSYTRSWMGEYSPYYFLAARAAYAVTDHWSAQALVMNGWQCIEDNNDAKSLGAQIAYNDNRVNAAVNGYVGADRAHDDKHWRAFADAFATVRVAKPLQLAVSADVGEEAQPGGRIALWYAAQLDARVEIVRRVALVARGEAYRDDQGAITGAAQTLGEGTLTLDIRPTAFLIVKVEGRVDHSTAPIFTAARLPDGTLAMRRDQLLAVLGVVAYY